MSDAQKPKTDKTKANEAADKAHAEADKIIRVTHEAEAAAKAAEKAEAAARAALEKAEAAKAEAEAAAKAAIDAEYKAIAETTKSTTAKAQDYTFKREGEEIFRREMGEPEFFLHKKDRFPLPILSPEQQDELTRKVEIPVDNTPKYEPVNVLSPEYGGVSAYESGIGGFLEESRTRLAKLKNDPNAKEKDIAEAKHKVTYLESLHENYFLGMNVFRTAKGGRSKFTK